MPYPTTPTEVVKLLQNDITTLRLHAHVQERSTTTFATYNRPHRAVNRSPRKQSIESGLPLTEVAVCKNSIEIDRRSSQLFTVRQAKRGVQLQCCHSSERANRDSSVDAGADNERARGGDQYLSFLPPSLPPSATLPRSSPLRCRNRESSPSPPLPRLDIVLPEKEKKII